MPKFRVTAAVHGGKYIGEFEAATKEAALELAEQSDEAYVGLCHQCSSQCEDAEIASMTAEEVEDDE